MSFNTIPELAVFLRQFSARRGWEDVHNPKNLAMALSVEAAELSEHFQWLTERQSMELETSQREAVSLEMADVLNYLVRMADRLDIDLLDAARRKVVLNAEKYPVTHRWCRDCGKYVHCFFDKFPRSAEQGDYCGECFGANIQSRADEEANRAEAQNSAD